MRAAEEFCLRRKMGMIAPAPMEEEHLAVNLAQYLYKRELHPLSC